MGHLLIAEGDLDEWIKGEMRAAASVLGHELTIFDSGTEPDFEEFDAVLAIGAGHQLNVVAFQALPHFSISNDFEDAISIQSKADLGSDHKFEVVAGVNPMMDRLNRWLLGLLGQEPEQRVEPAADTLTDEIRINVEVFVTLWGEVAPELNRVRLRERDAMSGRQRERPVVVAGFVDAPVFHSEVELPVVLEVPVGS